MAAIAPARVTLPERPLGPYLPPPSKSESFYALPVPPSSQDSSPAPAAAVSPAWVPPPMPAQPPWAKDPRYMKEHGGPALGPKPLVHRQQSMRIAKIALGYYNKKNKIKLELLEVGPVVSVASSFYPYKHMNFTARSSKEGSREQLFFAELQLCSRKQNPSGFNVICCEPLGSDSTAGRKAGWGVENPQGTSPEKDVDFTFCFGCGPNIFHPKGTKYAGGHCTVPHIYNSAMI
ncbi:hypothetical protein QYE76_021667 [Lolium multiflorum]|uniref:DUF3615 domain-containing protein n=1 Tax=Lolium multiflorum TaxID=4521 RepID=A0AAD8R8E6_LOLMU|nr:hypothetical protein QYE76_021667 [Lolium multiflorum]